MIASFESCSTATSSRALCVTQHRDVCEGDDGAFDLLRVGAIGQDPRQEGLARRRVNLGGKAAGHPLDPSQVARTGRVFTVEENPRVLGWGAEVISIIADEAFYDLDGPPVRITSPHIPLPAADLLEDMVIPSVERVTDTIRRAMSA